MVSWMGAIALAAVMVALSNGKSARSNLILLVTGCGISLYGALVSVAQGFSWDEVLSLQQYGNVGRVIVIGYGLTLGAVARGAYLLIR